MSLLTPRQMFDLAQEHHRAGRLAQAEPLYRQLLQREPRHPELLHLLGLIAYQVRKFEPARALMEQAISLSPQTAHYHANLGSVLLDAGELERALAAFRASIHRDPTNPAAWYNMGLAHAQSRQWADAVASYERALSLNPDYPYAILNLGQALAGVGRREEGIVLYRQHLAKHPDDYAVTVNLGSLLRETGELDEAIECYRRATALRPEESIAHNNLGLALKDQGSIDHAIASFRRSVELNPASPAIHSNLIYAMLFSPRTAPGDFAAEEHRWNERHARPLAPARRPHNNDRSPERRLRIGYVSPDFRRHPSTHYLLPVLERHDGSHFETFCYSNMPADAITPRYIAAASGWREIFTLSDEQVAELIRRDQIDILVDLALHTSDNRLTVFARKPAPVQLSCIGYPGSTGLETIDYRLTDPYLDPPEMDATVSGERPWRLPESWCCYEPPPDAPEISSLPALAAGQVTFGSLNNFSKVNDQVLEVWARLLSWVKDSRLVLLAHAGQHRRWVQDFLSARGIDPARVEFFDFIPPGSDRGTFEHLRRYHQVDIGLDTFPYTGMTTSLDALWMGVPVISLVGSFTPTRGGLGLLTNIGLPELAVDSAEAYVRQASALAADLPRLSELRDTMRARLKASPLLDAARFTRHLENAYREMWRRWCAEGSAG